MTQRQGPQRTHADLLATTTETYANMHERLRAVAHQAAADARERNDNAEVVAAARQYVNTNTEHTNERGNGNDAT